MSNRKPRGYWTFETCKQEVLKFEYLYDFRKESKSCYVVICNNNWNNLLCSHMKKKPKRLKSLTEEKCRIKALEYKSRKSFREECPKIYDFICKNKWLDKLCGHQKLMKKRNGYWTKERCKKEAIKYKTRSDFRQYSSSAYSISVKNKWLDDICTDYEIQGTHYKRFIYSYEFSNNYVYVGLTYNISKRKRQHLESGAVFEHTKKTNILPNFKQLIKEPVFIDEAVLLEESFLNDYIKNGWIPLNKAKTGGIGGGKSKWTFDNIYEIALKYSKKSHFCNDYSWVCQISRMKGWFDKITEHMVSDTKPSNYWNYENCKIEALKYNTKKDFENNCTSAYQSVKRNGWIEDLCSHMQLFRVPNGYYTLEKCIELAKDCDNISEFKLKYISAYTYMYKNKWKNIIEPYFKYK